MYLLIYDIDDYPGNGGGTYCKEPNSLYEMDQTVNELHEEYGSRLQIRWAVSTLEEYVYNPVETVIKLKRID